VCFSATANFVGSAVVGAVGVATLAQVRQGREVLFAAVPLLFAVHQFAEGFVWLSLQGQVSVAVGDAAAYGYLLYAQGLLPVLMPLGVLLVEPSRRSRQWIAPFVGLGLAAGIYLFWIDVARPIGYQIINNSVAYENEGSLVGLFAVLYVVAVCGSALLSGYGWIVAFGVANLVGLTVTGILLASSFTSVWCAYAAGVSVMVLLFFRRRRREEGAGERPPAPQPTRRSSRERAVRQPGGEPVAAVSRGFPRWSRVQAGAELLTAALQVWLTNIIVFGLAFWELDRGGPVARTQLPRDRLPAADFRFSQGENDDAVVEVAVGSSGRADWVPTLIDYLYESVTNSTAFSPTDTMPLTTWAKLLMSVESVGALLTSVGGAQRRADRGPATRSRPSTSRCGTSMPRCWTLPLHRLLGAVHAGGARLRQRRVHHLRPGPAS
jgi:hypothetical protein